MSCLNCGREVDNRQFCSRDCQDEYLESVSEIGECEVCGHYVEGLRDKETIDGKPIKVCGLCLESAEFDDDGYLILKGETVHEPINISEDIGNRPS